MPKTSPIVCPLCCAQRWVQHATRHRLHNHSSATSTQDLLPAPPCPTHSPAPSLTVTLSPSLGLNSAPRQVRGSDHSSEPLRTSAATVGTLLQPARGQARGVMVKARSCLPAA
jgi:hypothetical protein